MLKLFVPNLNKIAENLKITSTFHNIIFKLFTNIYYYYSFFLFSILHVNYENKKISEKNNIYNHTIQLNNLGILSNPL